MHIIYQLIEEKILLDWHPIQQKKQTSSREITCGKFEQMNSIFQTQRLSNMMKWVRTHAHHISVYNFVMGFQNHNQAYLVSHNFFFLFLQLLNFKDKGLMHRKNPNQLYIQKPKLLSKQIHTNGNQNFNVNLRRNEITPNLHNQLLIVSSTVLSPCKTSKIEVFGVLHGPQVTCKFLTEKRVFNLCDLDLKHVT